MTQQTEEAQKHQVCILYVDSRYGYGAELKHNYRSYKSQAIAKLFAERAARQMRDEGYDSVMRGVFMQDGQFWKTVGSYFDV